MIAPEPPNADDLLPRILAAWPKLELRHRRRLLREAEQLAGVAELEHKSTLAPVVPGEGRWLPAPEAAAMLGVATDTLRRWLQSGKLPAGSGERIGNLMHYDPKVIERFQKEGNP